MGMSFVTHLVLVMFLLFLGFSSQPKGTEGEELRRTGIVLAVVSEENETQYIQDAVTDQPDDEVIEDASQQDPASTPPPAIAMEARSNDRPELPGFESMDSNLDATQFADANETNRFEAQHELSEAELKLIKSEQRLLASRQPKGNPATIGVFGTEGLNGRNFVFVLDRSKSMGASGLGVIQAARNELSAAIDELEPNHRFQIIGYHQRTVTMKERQMLPATAENKGLVRNYISGLAAFGATNHENGLIAAAAFQPDIIVLMTDGDYPGLNSTKLKLIKRGLPSGCQVHCIQFGIGPSQKTTNFMRKLAEQNHGTYRYIDVSKWKSN